MFVLTGKQLRLFGLTRSRIVLFLGLALLAAFFDSFSMAMFLPILEYVEKGQNAMVLADSSRLWAGIVKSFAFIGLPVTLIGLLGAIMVLILLRTGINYLRQCYSVWLTQDILHHIRTTIFTSLARAEYALFDAQSTGRIINLATTEAMRAGGYMGALINLIIQAVIIAGLLVVLLWLNPLMTLFASASLVLGSLLVFYFIRHTRQISAEVTHSNANFSFLLVERLTGIRLLKLSAAVERETARIERSSDQVRSRNYLIQKLNARVELLMDPMVTLLGLFILFFSVRIFRMSLAEVGLFMLILLRLLPLAKEFLRSRQTLHACSGGVNAILIGLEEAEKHRENGIGYGKTFIGLEQGVRFRNVSFRYPTANGPALQNVDLFIPAGRITALVGPSGAGKSTLVDLLPQLRRHEQGDILLDETPIIDFDLDSLRRGMAFVSQDAFIINDTVRNNLIFIRPGVSDTEILAALDKARAKEFVLSMPQGLDTVLGERGILVSGGQRQRLSLARALIQDAPLLILDEPTSALDSETELDIQLAIAEMRATGKKTILIIAHRLSTIRQADKIVVLSDGRVVEQGTHQELMVSEEWYARVSGMQSAGGRN
jgi:ABC-type multidrug transport system fused ATPase/permease subunit